MKLRSAVTPIVLTALLLTSLVAASCGGEDEVSPSPVGEDGGTDATTAEGGSPSTDASSEAGDALVAADVYDAASDAPADAAPDARISLEAGDACVPDCVGRECGNDGCGGQCGACSDTSSCWYGGRCLTLTKCNACGNCGGETCASNDCACAGDAGGCGASCADGTCFASTNGEADYTCAAGKTCEFGCRGGTMTCGVGSHCTLDCGGSNVSLSASCMGAASCTLLQGNCVANSPTIDCRDVGVCRVGFGENGPVTGAMSVDCTGATTCIVELNGSAGSAATVKCSVTNCLVSDSGATIVCPAGTTKTKIPNPLGPAPREDVWTCL